MSKKEAFKIVFDDLSSCRMFDGHYDAVNGKDAFMYGIGAVMAYIVWNVSPETYEQFDAEFIHNVMESKEKRGN